MKGATCDAANTTGCDQAPVLMPLGLSSTTATGPRTLPWGLTVDPATDTVCGRTTSRPRSCWFLDTQVSIPGGLSYFV
jgi:hypothetical protein